MPAWVELTLQFPKPLQTKPQPLFRFLWFFSIYLNLASRQKKRGKTRPQKRKLTLLKSEAASLKGKSKFTPSEVRQWFIYHGSGDMDSFIPAQISDARHPAEFTPPQTPTGPLWLPKLRVSKWVSETWLHTRCTCPISTSQFLHHRKLFYFHSGISDTFFFIFQCSGVSATSWSWWQKKQYKLRNYEVIKFWKVVKPKESILKKVLSALISKKKFHKVI